MSEANVVLFKRGVEAGNRFDVEALLELADPEVEWHAAIQVMLGGSAGVYRGHDGVRDWFKDLRVTLDELRVDLPDIRDLGDRVVALGQIRTRGRESGAVTESPVGYVVDFRNGKLLRIRSYLDPAKALEAAGLSR